MNQKQAKKMRQFARRQFGNEYSRRGRELAELHNRFIKPKPKWAPEWLWIKILGLFIYIRK